MFEHRHAIEDSSIDGDTHSLSITTFGRKHPVVVAGTVPNPTTPQVESKTRSQEQIDLDDWDLRTLIDRLGHPEPMDFTRHIPVPEAETSPVFDTWEDPPPTGQSIEEWAEVDLTGHGKESRDRPWQPRRHPGEQTRDHVILYPDLDGAVAPHLCPDGVFVHGTEGKCPGPGRISGTGPRYTTGYARSDAVDRHRTEISHHLVNRRLDHRHLCRACHRRRIGE